MPEETTVVTLRLRDETFKLAIGNIPIHAKAKFMDQTKRSVEWYFAEERFGELTMCALWFLVRLINGETLTWDETLTEWAVAGYTAADFSLIPDEGNGDDPEA